MSVTPGAEPEDLGATRTQIRGSNLLFAGQLFALVVNFAVQILIVRYLSKASYGTFAYALSIVAVGEAVAAFGLRRGTSRFMPIYEERGELHKAMGTLLFSVGTVLSLGIAVMLVVIGFRGTIGGSVPGETEAAVVLAIMVALVPVQALETLLDGVFAVFSRPRAIVLRKFVYAPLARLVVVVLLAAAGSGVVFLAAGYLLAGALGLAIYGSMLVRVLRERGLWRHLRRRSVRFPVREVLSFTVPLLTNDVTNALLLASGGVILGLLAGAQDVAELRAVLPVAMTMSYVLVSFGLLFIPLASRLFARGQWQELDRLYWQTTLWTTVLAFPVLATCVILAEPLTTLLFGERYAGSAPVLALLALGQFVNAAGGQNGVLLGVFARVRYIMLANLAAVAVNLVLVLALIPPYEAVGAAVAMAATLLVLNAIRQVGVARLTEVRGVGTEYLPVYAVVAGTAALGLAAELLLSPPLAVGIGLVVLACVAVFASARSQMRLAETFPELARLPLVGRVLGAAGRA